MASLYFWMVSLKERLLWSTSFIILTVWMMRSVIASLVSLEVEALFMVLTLAIEDSSSCFSLKNFSMLSLSLIILSVTSCFLVAELSLFSVQADEADPCLSGRSLLIGNSCSTSPKGVLLFYLISSCYGICTFLRLFLII